MTWWVYMLECEDGRLYTGITTNIARRMNEHVQGNGGRFTKAFGATKVIYQERAESESEAKSREAQLKGWTRAKKLALVQGNIACLKTV